MLAMEPVCSALFSESRRLGDLGLQPPLLTSVVALLSAMRTGARCEMEQRAVINALGLHSDHFLRDWNRPCGRGDGWDMEDASEYMSALLGFLMDELNVGTGAAMVPPVKETLSPWSAESVRSLIEQGARAASVCQASPLHDCLQVSRAFTCAFCLKSRYYAAAHVAGSVRSVRDRRPVNPPVPCWRCRCDCADGGFLLPLSVPSSPPTGKSRALFAC